MGLLGVHQAAAEKVHSRILGIHDLTHTAWIHVGLSTDTCDHMTSV